MYIIGVKGKDDRYYITIRIESSYLVNSIEIFFLIDTGASRTQLSPSDASRNFLYLNQYLKEDPFTYSGLGGDVKAYILPDCKLLFDTFNKKYNFNLGNLSILYPRTTRGYPTPTVNSMLGIDVLRHFDLLFENDHVLLRNKII